MANPMKTLLAIVVTWLAGCATGTLQQSSNQRVDLDSHMVLAAIARERQDGREAAEHYFAAALISDNRTLAELASEISRQFNLNELGLQAAELWQTLSPNEVRVHQFLGIFRLRAGDFDGAVAEFEQLLAATENHASALAFLVELLANEADTQTTTAVMAQLIVAYPGTPEGHYGLARLGLQSGDYPLALEHAERAVELQPEWVEAQLLYARILLISGRPLEGLALAESIAEEQPELEVRLQYAELLLSAGQHEPARELLDDILVQNPGLPEAVRALAFLTLTLNDLDASRGHFTELRSQPRYRDEAFFYLGRIAESEDQALQAMRLYSRVISGTNAVEAQLRAANLLSTTLGDQSGALQHLREFGIANPNYSTDMLIAETEMLLQLRRDEDAMQLLTNAVTESPNDQTLRDAHVQLHVAIAQGAISREELDSAQDTLKDGLRRYRGDTSLRYAQALLYQAQGRNRRSANALESLVRDQPDDAGFLNALGYLLTDQMNQHEQALEYLAEALALEPANPAIIDSMGWVLFNLGDYEAALSLLQRAYELFPDAEVAAHIVDTQWALGNHEQALELLQQKLRENPESRHLKELDQRLAP
jgi:tetratricopeptide (TPR) repeat protein